MSFKKYLIELKNEKLLFEEVNKHIEHLEDFVFDGQKGINKVIQFMGPIIDTLDGKSNKINVKIDGSPSLTFGTNPENGKFFVSTKGIFAKVPKIAYTESDIDMLFTSGVNKKLKDALKYLKEVTFNGIYQGDMMFGTGDKKIQEIDGKKYVTVTPNTITYAFPVNTNLAKDVMRAKIGIAIHGKYKGTIGNLSVSFNVNKSNFLKSPNVWLIDTHINDVSNINLNREDLRMITGILKSIDSKKDIVEKIDNKIGGLLKIYKNNRIKSNIGILPAEAGIQDFEKFIDEKYDNDINILKTEKSKQAKTLERDNIFNYIDNNSDNILLIFKIYNWFVKIKMIVLKKLNQINSIGTFIKQGNDYVVTNPEGFVVISNDGNICKLVDRLEFSRYNWIIPKNW